MQRGEPSSFFQVVDVREKEKSQASKKGAWYTKKNQGRSTTGESVQQQKNLHNLVAYPTPSMQKKHPERV